MLKKRVIDYLQGDVLAKIMSLAALMVIGAMASKSDIATYNMMIFVAEMMAVFISFGADAAIVKFYREYSTKDVFNNYVFQNALNVCVAAGGLYLFGVVFKEGTYRFILEYYIAILFLAISLSVNSITRAHMISLNQSVRVKWFSIISGMLNLSSILLISSVVGLTVLALAVSRIAGLLIFVVFFVYLVAKQVDTKSINLELTKKMYRYSVPLLISAVVGTLSLYISRIVLAEYVSEYELGIFSYFIMLMASVSLLLHSFNQAWFPHLFDLYREAGEGAAIAEINKKLSAVITISFIYVFASIIVYQASNQISLNLNGYYAYKYILFMLADSLVFGALYIVINPLLYIKAQTKYVALASLILLIVNVCMALVFIEAWGIFGAAISVVAITVLTFSLYLMFAQKDIQNKLINRGNVWSISILTALLLIKYQYIYSAVK